MTVPRGAVPRAERTLLGVGCPELGGIGSELGGAVWYGPLVGLEQDGLSPPAAWSAVKSKEVADYERGPRYADVIIATEKVDHSWSVADEYELGLEL